MSEIAKVSEMNTMPPGRFVPASDLLKVSLATCALDHFNPRGKPPLADRSWSLYGGSPLFRAMLATAYELQNHVRLREDDAGYRLVKELSELCKPLSKEDFLSVARRVLVLVKKDSQTAVFHYRSTLVREVPYLTAVSKEALESYCAMLFAGYKEPLVDFCVEVGCRFRLIRSESELQKHLLQWAELEVAF